MTDSLSKTLIIRFSSIGDIVLSSLLVRTFHARFPDCQLDFVVKEEFADLVRFNPNISNVLTLRKESAFEDLQSLRSTIADNNYDLIIDIHDSLRSRFVAFGAKRVVRINKRKLARFLLLKLRIDLYATLGGSPSVALRYIEPVRSFGVKDDGKGLNVFFPEIDQQKTSALVREAGFGAGTNVIGICPSARHNTKMWLMERFSETAVSLSIQHKSGIILFGAGDVEGRRCRAIEERVRSLNPEAKMLNCANRLSLTETAAMMDECSLILTNDSGLMHIAAARKRKIVAIFGSTVRELGFFPFGTQHIVVENNNLNCRPCSHIGLAECPKGHFKCINDISTTQVIACANTLLETRPQ